MHLALAVGTLLQSVVRTFVVGNALVSFGGCGSVTRLVLTECR